jgi:2-oxo-3-hexenedioate decarboxylase
MSLTPQQIATLAEVLDNAALQAKPVPQLTLRYQDLDEADGYDIQHALRRRRVERGAKIVGMKAGVTSRAKMRQVGISTPSYGFLTDDSAVMDGGEIARSGLIHPRVEPEIAFVLKKPLRGPGCHIGAVLAATDFVMPALEIIDSRYQNFKFDFASVLADNSSSARFVLGGRARPADELDLRTLGIAFEHNGKPFAFGAGAAVLGHPALAVALIANLLASRDEGLEAGSVVLTGGITEAVACEAGDHVSLRVQELGSVSTRFV